ILHWTTEFSSPRVRKAAFPVLVTLSNAAVTHAQPPTRPVCVRPLAQRLDVWMLSPPSPGALPLQTRLGSSVHDSRVGPFPSLSKSCEVKPRCASTHLFFHQASRCLPILTRSCPTFSLFVPLWPM